MHVLLETDKFFYLNVKLDFLKRAHSFNEKNVSFRGKPFELTSLFFDYYYFGCGYRVREKEQKSCVAGLQQE